MVTLTESEKDLFQQARENDLNPFSEHFFKLPYSGTVYTPEDREDTYAVLYDEWVKQGKPGDKFDLMIRDQITSYLVAWGGYGAYPIIIFPHGYIFLPWGLRMLTANRVVTVAEGGTGSAKCLPRGSLIQCTNGSRKPIEDLAVGEHVLGVDQHYKLREQTVTGVFDNGPKPLVRLTLSLGQELLCTPNHPLLTVGGWVEASKLNEGDYVAVPRTLSAVGEETLRNEELILLGLLLGDGCLCRGRGSPYFTNTNVMLQTLFQECVAAMSCDFKTRRVHSRDRAYTLAVTDTAQGRTNRFRDWCKQMGIDGLKSHEKYVPESLFSQPRESIALFLNSLYACDGYASAASKQPIVSYASVSLTLVKDVQSLLLRFAIISRIRRRVANYKNKVYYTLTIDKKDHVRRFLQDIGIYGKDDSEVYEAVAEDNPRLSGSEDIIPRKDVRPYIKRRAKERGTPLNRKLSDGSRPNENFRMRKNPTRWKLKEYANWLDDSWLRDLSESDVYWARVVSTEQSLEDETFNLEVVPDRNYVASGVITHNTSTVAVAALIKCAIYAGFDFLNVGPSYLSAADLMEETAKWIADGPYERFVVRTKSHELWRQKPYPRMVIDTGLGSHSTITCLTLGVQARLGNVVLGKGYDWINVDEASLVDDVGEAIPKLITRYRGTRRTGMPRHAVPAFSLITNPHHGNMGFEDMKARAIAETDEPEGIYHFVRPSVEENIYITKQQLRTQRSILTEAEQERWLKGLDDQFKTQGTIPLVLIDNCREIYLDDLVDRSCSDGFYEARKEMGVVHYELPPEETSEYLAWGDPGTGNLISMRVNNVPTVGVFDITDFPAGPAVLVAMHVLDGGGRYAPWINSIKHMMIKYRVSVAAYDATGMGRAFSEWPDMQQFPLYPVSLGGNNKGTARTMFMLFCDKGLFAWPKIKMLWHQATVYRESGPRRHKIPDDLIAGLFVASFYLRFRFWGELSKMFKWEEQLVQELTPRDPGRRARSRYQRRKSRYA